MSCLITEKLEAIPNGQPLPAQRASDDVKLCTCQIRTCAGEGEHVFASGRLVVWRNKESVLTSVKESRVCQFLGKLYITSDSWELIMRILIVTKSKHALITMKMEMFYSGVNLAWYLDIYILYMYVYILILDFSGWWSYILYWIVLVLKKSIVSCYLANISWISVGDHMIRSGFNKSIVTRISEECTLIANPLLFSSVAILFNKRKS